MNPEKQQAFMTELNALCEKYGVEKPFISKIEPDEKDMERLENIRKELMGIISLPGDMAEIGVYKGKTAKHIHNVAPLKTLHLYDTFAGIVEADSSVDVHGNGEFGDTSYEAVKNELGEDHVKYHVGTFPYTFDEKDTVFCFVYSDTDTYFGAKATLDIFAPLMVSGGKIMFDDYGWKGCPGIKKAIDEFIALERQQVKYHSLKLTYPEGEDTQFTITF